MAGDNAPTKGSIIKVLGILAAVTVFELLIFYLVKVWDVFSMSHMLFVITMIALSLVKCFFIVGEFMHMKYEKKQFVFYTIIGVVLLLWFIVAILWEGLAWNSVRFPM